MADDAEGLAGKARQEQVVGGDRAFGDLGDVAHWDTAEVGGIGFLAFGVNIGGENAFSLDSSPLGGPRDPKVESANAAKKVDEPDGPGCFFRFAAHARP